MGKRRTNETTGRHEELTGRCQHRPVQGPDQHADQVREGTGNAEQGIESEVKEMISWMFVILAFYVGYVVHRVLLNIGEKPVYSETDLVMYGEQEFRKGFDEGYLKGKWK